MGPGEAVQSSLLGVHQTPESVKKFMKKVKSMEYAVYMWGIIVTEILEH